MTIVPVGVTQNPAFLGYNQIKFIWIVLVISTLQAETGEPTCSNTQGGTGMELKLEVIIIPVSDVDRAKQFYFVTRYLK